MKLIEAQNVRHKSKHPIVVLNYFASNDDFPSSGIKKYSAIEDLEEHDAHRFHFSEHDPDSGHIANFLLNKQQFMTKAATEMEFIDDDDMMDEDDKRESKEVLEGFVTQAENMHPKEGQEKFLMYCDYEESAHLTVILCTPLEMKRLREMGRRANE
jgi:hypothetical protein